MRISQMIGKIVLPLGLIVLASACSQGPRLADGSATTQVTSQAEIDAILSLLDQGEAVKARKRIVAALRHDPLNPSLLSLRGSIDEDPREMLGPPGFSYTARPGDTMSALAEKFLGNRLKAYQLARYNGIEVPASLRPGQELKIPKQAAEAAAPAPKKPRREAVEHSRTQPQRTVEQAKPSAPAANPDAARKARTAGLAALNSGKPRQAVALLSRAASLDPGSSAIARDLARAKRIAATVDAQN